MEEAGPTPSAGAAAPIRTDNAASIEAITIGFTFLVKSCRAAGIRGSDRRESACTLAHRVRVPQAEPAHHTRSGRSRRDPESARNTGQMTEKSPMVRSLVVGLRLEFVRDAPML